MATHSSTRADMQRRLAEILSPRSGLSADARLFGVCMLQERVDWQELAPHQRHAVGTSWAYRIGVRATGDQATAEAWSRGVLAADAPQYVAEWAGEVCAAQRECPHPDVVALAIERDPETGHARQVGYCTVHWSLDIRDRVTALDRQWRANGSPQPDPNTGGTLARQFPEVDWETHYSWATGRAVAVAAPTVSHARPHLRVLAGGG